MVAGVSPCGVAAGVPEAVSLSEPQAATASRPTAADNAVTTSRARCRRGRRPGRSCPASRSCPVSRSCPAASSCRETAVTPVAFHASEQLRHPRGDRIPGTGRHPGTGRRPRGAGRRRRRSCDVELAGRGGQVHRPVEHPLGLGAPRSQPLRVVGDEVGEHELTHPGEPRRLGRVEGAEVAVAAVVGQLEGGPSARRRSTPRARSTRASVTPVSPV